jgi:integrase
MKTRPLPPYLKRWFDARRGKVYLQFRRRGYKTVALRGPLGSDDFWLDYNTALKGKIEPGASQSIPGSVTAAIAAYYGSQAWAVLSDGTQGMRRAILEKFRERYGKGALTQITTNFIEAYLDSLKPHAARNHLKALRGLLRYAKHDVTGQLRLAKAKSTKHASWPIELMAQYEATHAIGSKARLAFALARYTGAGRSEIARLGPACVKGSTFVIARQKTGVAAIIPLHPTLKAIIDATPLTGLTTFLISKSGRPYRPADLSDEFRHWCNQAAIPPHFTLHGLRHALGDALAEAGCSASEVGAVLGHASAKTALHYTQSADRTRMAHTAMNKLITGGG